MSLPKLIEAQNPKDDGSKKRRPRGEFGPSRKSNPKAPVSTPSGERSSGTLLGGLLLGVAFPFSAVSIFSPDLTGSLGEHFSSSADALVGQAKLLFPLLMASYGLHFLFPRSRRPIQMTWAPTLLWTSLVLLAQRMGGQGGQLGAILDSLLLRSVGPMGAWMVAGICAPVFLSWVFRLQLGDCGRYVAEKLHSVQDYLNHRLDEIRHSSSNWNQGGSAWLSGEDEVSVEQAPYDSVEMESSERPLPFHSLEGEPRSGKILGRSIPDPKPAPKRCPIENRDLRRRASEPSWEPEDEDALPFEPTRPQPTVRGIGQPRVPRGKHNDSASGEFPALLPTPSPELPNPVPGKAATTSTPSPASAASFEPLSSCEEVLDFRGHNLSHSLEGALAPIQFTKSQETAMQAAASRSPLTSVKSGPSTNPQKPSPRDSRPLHADQPELAQQAQNDSLEESSAETQGPVVAAPSLPQSGLSQSELTLESSLEGPESLEEVEWPVASGTLLPAKPSNQEAEASPDQELDPESLEVIDEELVLEVPPPAKSEVPPPRRFTEIASDGQMLLFPEPEKEPPPTYRLPPLALLNDSPGAHTVKVHEDKSADLLDALASFGVAANLLDIVRGPAVTRYELQPARGVKVNRFTSLTNDIALALAATAVRIEAPIPGKSAIGIEVPNANTDLVVIKDIIASQRFRKSSGMSIALGKDLGGNPIFANLQKMPHLLVAGTTGSGKSVCVNALVLSLLYRFSPREVQILMIDPKQVELSIYEGIPHLICLSKGMDGAPVKNEGAIICDPKKAALALNQIVELMEFRYGLFAQARVRNLEEYNQTDADALPWVVVIIDELADLMMVASKSVETSICRIAQKARAAGIHLVLATQRPSADVITGLIKVNVPSRIAFAVSSQVDSRVILDTGGAEQLLGKGDMLFCPVDASDPRRVQGCFVTNEEILRIVEWWKAQASPENLIELKAADVSESDDQEEEEGDADDELVQQALQVILKRRQASASLLQTELKVGYARARRLIYLMEKKGYIGPQDGSKPRKILYGASE